jgi:hypothetical protein
MADEACGSGELHRLDPVNASSRCRHRQNTNRRTDAIPLRGMPAPTTQISKGLGVPRGGPIPDGEVTSLRCSPVSCATCLPRRFR